MFQQGVKRELNCCSPSEPISQRKRSRVDDTISDALVLVNPITALRNLIDLPKFSFKSQDEPIKLFTVSTFFNRVRYKATDSSDFGGAKTKLASQILHSYILNSAFLNDPSANVPLTHHAKIIEGRNYSVYIVGQEKNVQESADWMPYSLYELKPGTKIGVTSNCDPNGTQNYIETVIINGTSYHGFGSLQELAQKEAVRSALSSFTPEDMGFDSAAHSSSPVTVHENKNKVCFVQNQALATLNFLKPPTESVVIKKDVNMTFGGVDYFGFSDTAKIARRNAAYLALTQLSPEEAEKLSMMIPPIYLVRKGEEVSVPYLNNAARRAKRREHLQRINSQDPVEEDHSFGDYIAQMVDKVFNQFKDADSSIPHYKVLAGVVMSNGIAINGSQLICVATGNDCISGCHLSTKGEAVNDCHAVVLARRGLVSFLYDQLEKYGTQPEESVFEPAGNVDGLLPHRFKIKDGILFHFYVSSPPCGDACLRNNDSTGQPSALGALQMKVEGIDGGTVPVRDIKNFAGFTMDQRLLTMSCSDKMMRWSVVGAQGTLLSQLIDPVYFHSVVVGNLLHPESLRRAIIGRVENLKGIPPPFMVMQPTIATTSVLKSIPTHTQKYSVCWVKGWIQHEIIDCNKGKITNTNGETGLSELCKCRFFQRFIALASSYHSIRSLMESIEMSYGKMKAVAEGYRKTDELLMEFLDRAGLGLWIKKTN